jgi:hypothetical protein
MLYGERDRAIVYRGDAEEDSSSEATSLEFTDVLDVSELGGWNLRFRVHTRSSSGIPEGNAELRVHHVAAARIEGPMSLVGCVTDARTGLPIQGVRVRSDSITTAGRPKVCSTNRRGMYALALKPGQERLIEVEAKGFNCSQVQWAVYANLGEQIIKDIRLDRIELRHGDPIRAIPIPAGGAMSLAATSSSLIFNSDEGDPGILRRLSLDDGRVEEILETMTLSGLVEGPDGLYGVTTWPGRLIRIEPDGGTTPRYPLNLDYPRGLAWDGVRLWFVESDNVRGVYQLRAIDLDTGEQVVQLPTSHAIWGVACRGDRLYVCAPRNDQVYEVSLSKALRGTRLEAAVVGEFTGAYRYLTFSDDGRLWAIDAENQMFVEIHLE